MVGYASSFVPIVLPTTIRCGAFAATFRLGLGTTLRPRDRPKESPAPPFWPRVCGRTVPRRCQNSERNATARFVMRGDPGRGLRWPDAARDLVAFYVHDVTLDVSTRRTRRANKKADPLPGIGLIRSHGYVM